MESTFYNLKALLLCDGLKDRYKCLICLQLMVKPIQTFRGLSACEECYKDAITDKSTCPLDHEPVPNSGMFFRDKAKEREILNLICFCKNKMVGCEWKGTMKNFENHVRSCKLKDSRCQWCNYGIADGEEEQHLKECVELLKVGQCYFHNVGCLFKAESVEAMTIHFQKSSQFHLLLQSKYINSLQTENVKIESKYKILLQSCQQKEKETNMRIIQLEKSMKTMVESIESYKAEIRNEIVRLKESESLVPIGLQMNSIGDGKVVNDLRNVVNKNTKCIKDLDLINQLQENTTKDGRILWKIDRYNHRRNQAITGEITALHSAPCYVGNYGYKFCARVYLNGDGMGRGTHLSLFVVIMKSEYDNLLEWPFHLSIQMTLVNQKNQRFNICEKLIPQKDSSSFKRPTKDMNIASGCPMFVKIEKLEQEGFLVDDSVFIEVKVNA